MLGAGAEIPEAGGMGARREVGRWVWLAGPRSRRDKGTGGRDGCSVQEEARAQHTVGNLAHPPSECAWEVQGLSLLAWPLTQILKENKSYCWQESREMDMFPRLLASESCYANGG